MALERDLQTLELEKWIGAREAQVLARAEALVPGAGRDAIEPLLADASLYIGQADLQSDRVVRSPARLPTGRGRRTRSRRSRPRPR